MLAGYLLVLYEHGVAVAEIHDDRTGVGIYELYRRRDYLLTLALVFLAEHSAFRLAYTLDYDLLCGLSDGAAEILRLYLFLYRAAQNVALV